MIFVKSKIIKKIFFTVIFIQSSNSQEKKHLKWLEIRSFQKQNGLKDLIQLFATKKDDEVWLHRLLYYISYQSSKFGATV